MFVFEYNHTNYRDLLQALAASLGVPFENDRLNYPKEMASGFSELIEIQGGLQSIVFDYSFTVSHHLKRKKVSHEFYTLWFIEIIAANEVRFDIDNDSFHVNDAPF